MSTERELLDCPFCGSDDVSQSMGEKGDGTPWPYVECGACAACAEPDMWNRRAYADHITADEALLRQALEALTESRDSVWNDYLNDWRHGVKTRKAQLDELKRLAEAHDATIAALTQRLEKKS
jgi:transcription elongation factor Elf1